MPTLEITTHLGCALACRFCPQDRLVKTYPKGEPRDLALADFDAILRKVPPHVRIDFSGMAEPWLNRDATAMVVHAFEQRRMVAIYTTLQGMGPGDAAMLIDRYGHRITPDTPWVIHLPDAEGHMTGWRPSDAYRDTLRLFTGFLHDRAPSGLTFMTMSASGLVADPLRDLVPRALDAFTGISRAENLDRSDFTPSALLGRVRHTGAVLCKSTPFFDHNAMLPNGDVLLCCMDYSRAHVLGNLLRQSWQDIHAGQTMGTIRVRAMTPGDSGELLCRNCHNAANLCQNNETHWRLSDPAMWTAMPPSPPPAPPTPRKRGVLGRMFLLQH